MSSRPRRHRSSTSLLPSLQIEKLEDRRLLAAVVEVEPNNAFGSAQRIGGDSQYAISGSISSLADVDFYAFNARAGDTVNINAKALNPSATASEQFDPVIGLFSPSGNLVGVDDDSGSGSIWAAGLSFTVGTSGVWRVAVSDYSDFNFDGVGGNGDGFGTDTGSYELAISGLTHCNPGEHFSGVLLPEIHLDIANIKSADIDLRFDELRLGFTGQATEASGVLCSAQSEVGTLIARAVVNGETQAIGNSVGQATIALFEDRVEWFTSGFQASAVEPIALPLFNTGPLYFTYDLASNGLDSAGDSWETILRQAEADIHVQLSEQLFGDYSNLLVWEDPGNTELLITSLGGGQVGLTESGVAQNIPGSAYFSSVPLALVAAPSETVYQVDVLGTASGSYELVTAYVAGGSVVSQQSVTGTSWAGSIDSYVTTVELSSGAITAVPGTLQQQVPADVRQHSVNLASRGVVPAAILSDGGFDATSVDPASVRLFQGTAVRSTLEDVDGDGDLDLLLHFRVQETGLRELYIDAVMADVSDDLSASKRQSVVVPLSGETLTGQSFVSSDTVDLFLAGRAFRELLLEMGG